MTEQSADQPPGSDDDGAQGGSPDRRSDLGEAYLSVMSPAARLSIGRSLREFALALPVPQLDLSVVNKSLTVMAESLAKAILPQIEPILANLRSLAGDLLSRLLPANLRGVQFSFGDLEVLAEEGITVYAVPSASVVRRLLRASTTAARREVLGRYFEQIMSDCDQLLDECVAQITREAVVFARAGLAAARDGHSQAAQALWTNTLDSLLRSAYEPTVRRWFTDSEHASEQRRSLQVRTYLVVQPIAHGHHRYRPDDGDRIPRVFSRHASAHGVSRRQYSKRNGAQALLLLVSLIAYLNEL